MGIIVAIETLAPAGRNIKFIERADSEILNAVPYGQRAADSIEDERALDC